MNARVTRSIKGAVHKGRDAACRCYSGSDKKICFFLFLDRVPRGLSFVRPVNARQSEQLSWAVWSKHLRAAKVKQAHAHTHTHGQEGGFTVAVKESYHDRSDTKEKKRRVLTWATRRTKIRSHCSGWTLTGKTSSSPVNRRVTTGGGKSHVQVRNGLHLQVSIKSQVSAVRIKQLIAQLKKNLQKSESWH